MPLIKQRNSTHDLMRSNGQFLMPKTHDSNYCLQSQHTPKTVMYLDLKVDLFRAEFPNDGSQTPSRSRWKCKHGFYKIK